MWKSLLASVLKFLGPALLEWGTTKLTPATPEAPAPESEVAE